MKTQGPWRRAKVPAALWCTRCERVGWSPPARMVTRCMPRTSWCSCSGCARAKSSAYRWTPSTWMVSNWISIISFSASAGGCCDRETKSEASDDPLPLPHIAATALKLRLEDRAEDKIKADSAWQEFGLLFTTRYGTPIEPRNFNRSWNARCAKAGVRKITAHDARRACGSLLADLDVHPRVAMRVLRHAQVSVTMEVYIEVSSEQTREALKRLGDSLA